MNVSKKIKLVGAFLATFAMGGAAQAYIVGIGWAFGVPGTITFDALHWHGAYGAAGSLIVDGTSYAFSSVTHNTATMTGLDGALVNGTYSGYDGAGTLTALGTGPAANDAALLMIGYMSPSVG